MTLCRSRGEPGRARHGDEQVQYRVWCSARRLPFSQAFAPQTQFAGLSAAEGPLQGTGPLPRFGGLRRELSRTARLSIAFMRE